MAPDGSTASPCSACFCGAALVDFVSLLPASAPAGLAPAIALSAPDSAALFGASAASSGDSRRDFFFFVLAINLDPVRRINAAQLSRFRLPPRNTHGTVRPTGSPAGSCGHDGSSNLGLKEP